MKEEISGRFQKIHTNQNLSTSSMPLLINYVLVFIICHMLKESKNTKKKNEFNRYILESQIELYKCKKKVGKCCIKKAEFYLSLKQIKKIKFRKSPRSKNHLHKYDKPKRTQPPNLTENISLVFEFCSFLF